MQFTEIIGQKRAKLQLAELIQSGKVPHALLITGRKGAGGLAIGLALARMLMCEQPTEQGACNTCAACGKSQRYIHPDLHFSFPTVGAKVTSDTYIKEFREFILESPYADAFTWLQKIGAENKQGNINVDECLSINRKLSFQVLEGKYKILLMWMPEYLGKEGNRLLKLIEEPPERTIFILVAEQTEQILQTILSRCQLIKLDPLSQSEVTEALVERKHLPKAQAESFAFLADGDYAEAEQMLGTEYRDDAIFFTAWLRACWQGDAATIMPLVDTFADLGRENQKQFFKYGLQFFRELIVALVAGNQALKLPPDIADVARKFAGVVGFEQCQAICEQINQDLYYIERNANARVLFTASSIQIHEILRKLVPIGAR
jgi:DNA polymerase III subunit delta'